MEKPIIRKKILLEKFPGKGGWTFAALPGVLPAKHTHFGWRKVKGSIDDFSFSQYYLMPMGNGNLFLPVKAAIRKQLNKKAGDWVMVELYPDDAPLPVPEDLLNCLADEPKAEKFFYSLNESEQKQYFDWISGTSIESTRIERMAAVVNRLAKGLRFKS
jgi:hypothetical protein